MPVWLISLALGGLGKLRDAALWLIKNPLYLACIVLGLGWLIAASENRHKGKLLIGKQGEIVSLTETNRGNVATIGRLIATLNDQSAHVRALATASDQRQKAAQDALKAAVARGKASEAHAALIDAARADSKPGGPFRTDRAVLDARGEL